MYRQEDIDELVKLYQEQSYERAFRFSENLVDQGSHEAIWFQADCYFFGYHVNEDIEKAIKLYELALSNGSFKAGISLASFYEPDITHIDNTVEIDRSISIYFYSQSLRLAIQAEKNGDCEAMYYLGLIYDSGLSVPENKKNALIWYIKSYESGYKFALNKLYEFYSSEQFYDFEKYHKYSKLLNESGLKVI